MLTATDTLDTQETKQKLGNLTKHPAGSLRELITLALPLMLTSLSGTLMLFIDRLVLAHLSPESMNGAASASMVFAIFQFGLISITGIAEVFVGQYNGAKQFAKLARPVWQMIWFSLLCAIPLITLGLGFSDNLLPQETVHEGGPFLKSLLWFGFLFPLNAALASFYIGQGKVKIVVISTMLTCMLNIVLDFILVFGVGSFQGLGTFGAGLATGLSQLVLAMILFATFVSSNNHLQFQTRNFALDLAQFKTCLKIALPNSIGHMLAIGAWTWVMIVLAKASFAHMTIFAITQSIWILLSFITEGNQKAICAISANLIGAQKSIVIPKVFRSGVMMQLLIVSILAIPFVFFPQWVITGFLSESAVTMDDQLLAMAAIACQWLLLPIFFDGVLWLICGILTAAGDTRFIMIANAVNAWLFGLLPCYFFIVHLQGNPLTGIYLTILFCFFNMVCFFARYKSKDWNKQYLLIGKGL